MSKPLTPRQAECVERLRAFAGLAFLDADAFARRGRWREHFGSRIGDAFDGRIVLEIGCADGSLLARVAAKHPRTAFIGLDWKYGDVLRAAGRVAGLANVALVRGRAQDLRRLFADGEIDEVWVFHPDPCASPVERPNRLIAEPFLLDAAAVLRGAGSVLALKTDHAGYYQSTLALLGVPPPDWPSLSPRVRLRDLEAGDTLPPHSAAVARVFEVGQVSTDFTGDAALQRHVAGRAFAGEQTVYEAKFAGKGRPIFYVELRRRDALSSAMEPMKPMQPMKPMEPMRPMEPMKPMEPVTGPWPAEYGQPNAAGGQNDVRYAYFADRRRLIVARGSEVREYDSGDHQIGGIQQAQGGDLSHLVFTSQHGPVALDQLRAVK